MNCIQESCWKSGRNNIRQLSRREWLKQTGVISTGILLNSAIVGCALKKNPTILLVSGWQDVNIGDIAHTPGLLHVLETFMPGSKIILCSGPFMWRLLPMQRSF